MNVRATFPDAVYLDLLESELYAQLLAVPGRLESHLSPGAAPLVVVDEVQRIEDDLKERDRLAGQARASLALIKGTVKFLQAANLAAVAAAIALPMWRDFFTSTLQRRGTFLAATAFMVLASLYFDQEIGLQEEKAL